MFRFTEFPAIFLSRLNYKLIFYVTLFICLTVWTSSNILLKYVRFNYVYAVPATSCLLCCFNLRGCWREAYFSGLFSQGIVRSQTSWVARKQRLSEVVSLQINVTWNNILDKACHKSTDFFFWLCRKHRWPIFLELFLYVFFSVLYFNIVPLHIFIDVFFLFTPWLFCILLRASTCMKCPRTAKLFSALGCTALCHEFEYLKIAFLCRLRPSCT